MRQPALFGLVSCPSCFPAGGSGCSAAGAGVPAGPSAAELGGRSARQWMLLGPSPGPWMSFGPGPWVPRSSCPWMLLGSCPCMPGRCCPGCPGAAGDVPGCVEEFVTLPTPRLHESWYLLSVPAGEQDAHTAGPSLVRRPQGPACRRPQVGGEVAAPGTPLRPATSHLRGGADSRDGLFCSAAGLCQRQPRHLPGREDDRGKCRGGGLSTEEPGAGRAGASLSELCCQSGSSCLGGLLKPTARGTGTATPLVFAAEG